MDSEDEKLVPVFIPSLVSVLLAQEQKKGSPLGDQEVLAARDNANCVMTPPSGKAAIEQGREYPDIDPENVWAEWQRFRASQSKAR